MDLLTKDKRSGLLEEMKFFYVFLIITILLSGCMYKNPYEQFYKPNRTFIEVDKNVNSTPEIEHISFGDIKARRLYYLTRHYHLIGESNFNVGNIGGEDLEAIEFAKKIGASVVLIAKEYTNTESGNIALTTPTENITYHSGNIGGTGYYGSSKSYGTKTTNIPYSDRRYNYNATFFGKFVKPVSWGLIFDDTDELTKSEIGRNDGVVVIATLQNSPFYKANIVHGDLITRANKDNFLNADKFEKILDESDIVEIELLRNGRKYSKTVSRAKTTTQQVNKSIRTDIKTNEQNLNNSQSSDDLRKKLLKMYINKEITKKEYVELMKKPE